MQKLEAAAMFMQQNFNNISFLFPNSIDIEKFKNLSTSTPFSEEAISFLNALSKEITKNPQVRNYPDVATFAFFCRKANVIHLKQGYEDENLIRLGRGIIFHIAPSNVPVNFAYSLLCGILSGNLNIVRVPSNNFEQVTIICNAIETISHISEFKSITEKIALIRYDRNSSATSIFSSICDVRVIWGGDETISQIRKNIIPARSFDVTFADRYSICIINAEQYLFENDQKKIAFGFYNDTYLFDQNACTAPHLITWIGSKEKVSKAKTIFWNELYNIVIQKYGPIQPVIAVDKLTAFYNQSVKSEGINKLVASDNLLWRIELGNLTSNIDEFRCTSGYFLEYHAEALMELAGIVNRKYQTIAYYGFSENELNEFVLNSKLFGIDRIVPIGRTTEFSLIWDGFDMIRTLSRCCEIL
jgi:hypothetical protein